MELLTAVKEKYLLEASLEDLHQESLSWLNTVSFWEDENKFYKNLLNNKLFQNVSQKDKLNINTLLDNIIGNKLITFKSEISLHERNLDTLLISNIGNDDYRRKHKSLLQKFIEFDQGMREIKSGVFELLKLVNANFFNANETLHTIYERRSVRKFKNNPIDKLHIEQLIAAGRMAPSAMNKQSWKFYVLTNKEKIKLYSSEISNVVKNVLHLTLKTSIDKESDPIFHGAPVVIFITAPKDNEWSSLDIGMCSQNIMLAARSLGYDSCPIGLAKAMDKTKVYGELKIPTSEEIKLALVIGYADEKPEIHKRNTDNIVFLN